MRDENGSLVAEPLRRGGSHCRFHARSFVARPVEELAPKAVVVFLDFETTGLLLGAQDNAQTPKVRTLC